MLKDLLKKTSNKKNNEKILNAIADGYVDIKIFEYNKDRTDKKLVYHDTGDNTVTDWMRQAIVRLLSGYPLSQRGKDAWSVIGDGEANFALTPITTYNEANHSTGKNKDGCTIGISGAKYLGNEGYRNHFVQYDLDDDDKNKWKYPVFPTKILLGTGKEYTNWEALQLDNEEENREWYDKMVTWYGKGQGVTEAKRMFNKWCDEEAINTYTATVGSDGIYSGTGNLLKTVTVPNPNEESGLDETPAEMSIMYGVRGAVKTPYLPGLKYKANETTYSGEDIDSLNAEMLEPVVSDSGRLLKPHYRGVGAPCFIYFKRTEPSSNGTEKNLDWGTSAANVTLSRDLSSNFLNRITFRIVMPSQTSNEYYPYNGYTLRQIGLYNDCLLEDLDGQDSSIASKMPFGTLLAIKNISSFTKTADQEIVFTWTLTI